MTEIIISSDQSFWDNFANFLAAQIERVRLQMNISYGVLNGEPEAVNFLHHGRYQLTGITDILLFTDGLFLPKEDPLAGNDWQGLVDLYRHGGLQAVRDHVRLLQRDDPDCRCYPRFKRHDDIAAVAIQFHDHPQPMPIAREYALV